ncbi:MAG TPA: tetratricopeptide repeat protein, partial [Candidatus Caenarcaniphilales bacterium]
MQTNSAVVKILWLVGLAIISLPQVSLAYPALVQQTLQANQALSNLLNQGHQLVSRGSWADALQVYEQAAQLDGKNPRIFSAIGYVQARQENFEQAARAYQSAIDLEPENADFYYALGYSLGHLGDDPGAAAAYRRASQLNPKNIAAYEGLGIILTRQQDYR